MRSDPTPFFATLFLHYYEIKWIKRVKRNNIKGAKIFANAFRFMDDPSVLNEGGNLS